MAVYTSAQLSTHSCLSVLLQGCLRNFAGEPTAGRQRYAQGGGRAERHDFRESPDSTRILAQGRHLLLHEHCQNAAPVGGKTLLFEISSLGYETRVFATHTCRYLICWQLGIYCS